MRKKANLIIYVVISVIVTISFKNLCLVWNSKCKHVSGKIHTKIYDVHSVDHLVQKNFIGHGELIFGKNEKLFSWNGIKFNGGEWSL
jgi:hypothetical protein